MVHEDIERKGEDMADNDIDKGGSTPAAKVTSVLFACNINAVRAAMA